MWYQELLGCGQKEGVSCHDQCWLNTMIISAGSPPYKELHKAGIVEWKAEIQIRYHTLVTELLVYRSNLWSLFFPLFLTVSRRQ